MRKDFILLGLMVTCLGLTGCKDNVETMRTKCEKQLEKYVHTRSGELGVKDYKMKDKYEMSYGVETGCENANYKIFSGVKELTTGNYTEAYPYTCITYDNKYMAAGEDDMLKIRDMIIQGLTFKSSEDECARKEKVFKAMMNGEYMRYEKYINGGKK